MSDLSGKKAGRDCLFVKRSFWHVLHIVPRIVSDMERAPMVNTRVYVIFIARVPRVRRYTIVSCPVKLGDFGLIRASSSRPSPLLLLLIIFP